MGLGPPQTHKPETPPPVVSPGLLMYMWMGFLLLSDCRKSSCAITRLARLSSIWGGGN